MMMTEYDIRRLECMLLDDVSLEDDYDHPAVQITHLKINKDEFEMATWDHSLLVPNSETARHDRERIMFLDDVSLEDHFEYTTFPTLNPERMDGCDVEATDRGLLLKIFQDMLEDLVTIASTYLMGDNFCGVSWDLQTDSGQEATTHYNDAYTQAPENLIV